MKTEAPFEILLAQSTDSSHLQISWRPEKPARKPLLQARIEKYWQDEITASGKGDFIFNGALCTLLNWEMQDTALCLSLGQTDYKEHLFSNFCHTHMKAAADVQFEAKALGVSLILTTADDRVIMMRRSQQVGEAPGKVDVIGGHIHPGENRTDGVPDPYAAIRAEVAEELGAIRLRDLSCLGLLRTTATGKPEMIFTAQAKENATAIIGTAVENNSNEVSAWLTFPNSKQTLLSLLETQADQLSPSAAGALWLHARTQAIT